MGSCLCLILSCSFRIIFLLIRYVATITMKARLCWSAIRIIFLLIRYVATIRWKRLCWSAIKNCFQTLGVTIGLREHSRACEHCDFFASTSRDEKFALRVASSLESTTREQRALLIFPACSNPYVRILGFQVGHCHVQPTGVLDIYIETTSKVLRRKLKVHKVFLTILY